jgi:hypothetical protein
MIIQAILDSEEKFKEFEEITRDAICNMNLMLNNDIKELDEYTVILENFMQFQMNIKEFYSMLDQLKIETKKEFEDAKDNTVLPSINSELNLIYLQKISSNAIDLAEESVDLFEKITKKLGLDDLYQTITNKLTNNIIKN